MFQLTYDNSYKTNQIFNNSLKLHSTIPNYFYVASVSNVLWQCLKDLNEIATAMYNTTFS